MPYSCSHAKTHVVSPNHGKKQNISQILYLKVILTHRDCILERMGIFQRFLDWLRALFWKEEMELTLVGLQYSGKTTFVNVLGKLIFLYARPK